MNKGHSTSSLIQKKNKSFCNLEEKILTGQIFRVSSLKE